MSEIINVTKSAHNTDSDRINPESESQSVEIVTIGSEVTIVYSEAPEEELTFKIFDHSDTSYKLKGYFQTDIKELHDTHELSVAVRGKSKGDKVTYTAHTNDEYDITIVDIVNPKQP